MDDRDRFPWGCSCGRLCFPEDDECDACGGAFSADKLLKSEPAKKRFLKKAERADRRVLEGAGKVFDAVERSYAAAERQFDSHVLDGYGDLMRWLEPGVDERDAPNPWTIG